MKAEDFISLIEQERFDKISPNGLSLIAKRFRELESESKSNVSIDDTKKSKKLFNFKRFLK